MDGDILAPVVFPFEGGGCSLEDVYIDLDRFFPLLLLFCGLSRRVSRDAWVAANSFY
jgi:hypothetical protein